MKVWKSEIRMEKVIYYYKIMLNSFKTQYIYKAQVISKILFCILLYQIQMYIWKSVNLANNIEIYN